MKFISLLFIILILPLISLAQNQDDFSVIKKGTKTLGGRFYFITGKTEYETSNYKRTGFEVRPDYGYFIKDNLAIYGGLLFNIDSYNDTNPLFDGYNFERFGGGAAFSIRHFKRLIDKFYFVSTGNISLRYSKINYDNNFLDGKEWESSISSSAGILYFLNKKWSLETHPFSIIYTHKKTIASETTKNYDFSINGAISGINLTVRYYLPK
jgi:hypothetical protein